MKATYTPPFLLRNGHIQSIYPSLFRKTITPNYRREILETPDSDFLEVDWLQMGNKRLVILTHGLEGHSRRPYMNGMANYAASLNWDILAWNFRGCGDSPNRYIHSYHSGKTEDLAHIISHAQTYNYEEIALIGFSIGGNQTLLHLGREASEVPSNLIASVTFSVPFDLKSSSRHLAQFTHKLYMNNFLKSFHEKLKIKKNLFPDKINLNDFAKIKNFKQYDERFTAPMNGFCSAEEYWEKSSCLFYLKNISIPSLIINALDDPFLPKECYPKKEIEENTQLIFETPLYGGHVGFMPEKSTLLYYSERRAMVFLNERSKLKN